MAIKFHLDDYQLPQFIEKAKNFGDDHYAYVVTPNSDHVIRFYDDPSFRDLYESADFALLDSRFLALLLRISKGIQIPTCPGSDITAALFENVISPDDKIVLVGGNTAQAMQLAQKHGLHKLRHYDPPMGFIREPAEVEACLNFIERESPFRFCFLAVGCPQQEKLAQALQSRGKARGMALCIGASINFLTGIERRAPLWIQRLGMEWVFRLLNDPKRLARRYLVRGPRIFLLLSQLNFVLRSHP